jgi:hypothetical protein
MKVRTHVDNRLRTGRLAAPRSEAFPTAVESLESAWLRGAAKRFLNYAAALVERYCR